RLDCTVPFARPAAGLQGTCGGYALAVRAAHFLATSAVTADALPFMHPTAMQTNPTSALSDFTWADMVCPKAKHRGLTIAGLTVSVACIATKSAASCPSWVKMGRRRIEHILSALPPLATEERTFGIGSSVPIAAERNAAHRRIRIGRKRVLMAC